ncbi:MAG TPA: DUF3347 domain-containing protein [Sphingobacteriaceae bacterium]
MSFRNSNIRTVSGALLVLLFAFTSCSSGGTKIIDGISAHAGPADEPAKPKFDNSNVAALYDHYLHIKDALANSDPKEAKLGALALQSVVKTTKNAKAFTLAGNIARATGLAVQRASFSALSTEVEELIRSSTIKSGVIYKQYCPMAKNGSGAYWLSSEVDTRNPYYGKVIAGCGEVAEEIN